MIRRALLKGLIGMPFGTSRGQGFNNPVATSFAAGNTIISKRGVFIYNGSPAAGNLSESHTGSSSSGTDRYGNLYLGGDTTYLFSGGIYTAQQRIGASLTVYTAATEAGPWAAVAVLSDLGATGTWTIKNDIGGASAVALIVANGWLQLVGADLDTWNIAEALNEAIVSGPVNASTPGTSFPAAEHWHTPGALLNGWINTAGFTPFGYMFVQSPRNTVFIRGTISATAATSSTFFQLGAGYIPATENGYGVGATGGVPAGDTPNLRCDTSGNLLIASAAAVPAADTYFINGYISLD
jgi:hypothetical protein